MPYCKKRTLELEHLGGLIGLKATALFRWLQM